VSGYHRDHLATEAVAASHPLVVVPAAVVVGAVEPAPRDGRDQPSEEPLVPEVHPQGDLRLAAIPAEVPLPDQQAEQEADRQVGGEGRGILLLHGASA
jgi:hypothetical protein